MSAPERYFNREISWLGYHECYLRQADDEQLPLLEQLRYLSRAAEMLDRFSNTRVAALERLRGVVRRRLGLSRETPLQQLRRIRPRIHEAMAAIYARFGRLETALEAEGLRRIKAGQLNDRQLRRIENLFDQELAPILTPLALREPRDLLRLEPNMLQLLVRVRARNGARHVAIPLGRSANRFLTLQSEGGYDYVLLEDAVSTLAPRLLAGQEVIDCQTFRFLLTASDTRLRYAAPDLMDDVDLPAAEPQCVRLELEAGCPDAVRRFLRKGLEASSQVTMALPGPLDVAGFTPLTELSGFQGLRHEGWSASHHPDIDLSRPMFEVLGRRDQLLHHPIHVFDPVVRLVEDAARDPDVIAIKQVLGPYPPESAILEALQRAAENEKYVTAIVNTVPSDSADARPQWVRSLERATVQVAPCFGLPVHGALTVVVRREPQGIQRYVHFGTGGYDDHHYRQQFDFSLLLANDEFGSDALDFFNSTTGDSPPPELRKLTASPVNLRERFVEMIDNETHRRRQGQRAQITARVVAIADPDIIEALYRASAGGVKIRLQFRDVCCLKPDARYSENITAISVIDRLFEHGCVYSFHHGGDQPLYISPCDWDPVSLDFRRSLLIPVEDQVLQTRLTESLELGFRDSCQAYRLRGNGNWEALRGTNRRRAVRYQEESFRQAQAAVQDAEKSQPTMFEPHRAPSAPR